MPTQSYSEALKHYLRTLDGELTALTALGPHGYETDVWGAIQTVRAERGTKNLAGSHYESLDVDFNCSLSTLKTAYRTKARLWHPDRNQGNETATHRFRQVTAAFHALQDAGSREAYDRSLPPLLFPKADRESARHDLAEALKVSALELMTEGFSDRDIGKKLERLACPADLLKKITDEARHEFEAPARLRAKVQPMARELLRSRTPPHVILQEMLRENCGLDDANTLINQEARRWKRSLRRKLSKSATRSLIYTLLTAICAVVGWNAGYLPERITLFAIGCIPALWAVRHTFKLTVAIYSYFWIKALIQDRTKLSHPVV